MTGITGPGYPSFSAGQPFQNRRKPKDNKTFLDKWVSTVATWSARHGTGESLDRYLGLNEPAPSLALQRRFELLGMKAPFEQAHKPTLNYSNIFKLDNDHIRWRDFSFKNWGNTVNQNTYQFRQQVKAEPLKHFLQDVTAKDYAKQALWEGNIKPIKELFSGSKQNFCKNLSYTAGAGFVGFNIAQTGYQHYQYWKDKEDGSIGSQWKTAYETGKASLEKAFQSFGAWEAAGIGMAIGRALIPLGAFPLGGILVGALFSTIAYKALGKLFPALSKPEISGN